MFISVDVPEAPEGPLVVSNLHKTSATISWRPSPADGGSPITSYVVEIRESWKTSFSLVEKVPADQLTFDLTRLKEGQEYFVRVLSENKVGQSKPLESTQGFKPESPYSTLLSVLFKQLTLDAFLY